MANETEINYTDQQYGPPAQLRSTGPRAQFLRYSIAAIYGLTALIWSYSFFNDMVVHRPADFWFLVLTFVVPAAMLLGALWVLVDKAPWRMVVGLFLLLPAGAVWLLSLLLVLSGFRIH